MEEEKTALGHAPVHTCVGHACIRLKLSRIQFIRIILSLVPSLQEPSFNF
jgi:hypothetical protein